MNRFFAGLAIAFFAVSQADAQVHTWNGPFTGTTNWSTGTWNPSTPPTGGAVGTRIIFSQLGSGAYTAANDLGNPFLLSFLDLESGGGGVTVSSLASNTLQFGSSSVISQNGIGVAVISSTATLTGASSTMISGANFGNVQVSGVLSGDNSLNINRLSSQPFTGLVDLTGANIYGSGTDLQAGNLRVGNATALGTGTLRITGGTLGATTTTTIANPVLVNATNLVYSGFANLTLTGVIGEIGTSGVTLSSMTGSTLILQGTNTYTGPTNTVVNPRISSNGPTVGNLTFSGANGSSNLSSGFTFNGGGTLTLDNSAAGANNDDRIGNSAPVTISGGTLVVNGANGGATVENIGSFTGSGSVFVTMNAGTTGNTGTTLQADSLVRSNRAQFLFRANSANFGGPIGANVANLAFDSIPALFGGGGAAGTTTISIIPYAIGGITTGSTGTDLVTYGANGVRPLSTTANEYATTITDGSTTLNNVRLNAATAITLPTQINALVIASTTPFTGSTSTLTLANGTLLNTSAFTVPAAMTLNFGSEGVLFNNSTMTVDGVLTGTGGLTKTGTAALTLNNVANNVTGTLTINQGTIQITDPAAIASFSTIVMNGRASTSTPGLGLTGAVDATINKTMTVTDGFARLLSGTGTLTYAGQITGPGGVLINGGNVELTNATNNYTGQTRVFGGNLLVSGDSVLGNGGGVDFGALSTAGLRLTGNWTTSRQINISFSSQLDTNGFNWTVNSPLTGTGSAINKVGAGIWTLSQGGALGQSLTSGATTTTTTINVAAGELRVTNATGSATGTATVNINATSIVSGNGNIAGATTVAATAFVEPGQGPANVDTLRFGSTLVLNGTYTADVVTTIADRINVAGAVTLGAASILNFPGSNTYDAGTTYTLMQFPSLTGTFATTPGIPGSHMLVYNPTSIQLVPVPEPTAILAFAGLAFGVGYRIRRRVRSRRGA